MTFQAPARKKNALDNNKLALTAPSPVTGGTTAKLMWNLHNNNPRITVYTGDPSEKDNEKLNYGRIQAHLDLPAAYAVFDAIEQMTKPNVENNTKIKIENKNFTFFGGKRSDYPVVQSEVWCGKDRDGVIWISVTAKDRPMVKFCFLPTEFHHYYNGDGTQMDKGQASCYYARGYLYVLRQLYGQVAFTEFVDLQAQRNEKQNQGGNSRGGWGNKQGGGNYGGGNNSNRQPAAEPDGSDIPF